MATVAMAEVTLASRPPIKMNFSYPRDGRALLGHARGDVSGFAAGRWRGRRDTRHLPEKRCEIGWAGLGRRGRDGKKGQGGPIWWPVEANFLRLAKRRGDCWGISREKRGGISSVSLVCVPLSARGCHLLILSPSWLDQNEWTSELHAIPVEKAVSRSCMSSPSQMQHQADVGSLG